jgi:hypothetical protein
MGSDISRTTEVQRKCGLLFLLIITLGTLTTTSAAQNFAPAIDYPTQTQPLGIAEADFNRDGNLDVVVANSGSQSLSLFLGRGDGTFASPSIISLSPVPPGAIADIPQPVNVVTGDFNGDGNPDIAVAFNGTGITVQILLGNGDGTFLPGVNQLPKLSSQFTNFQLATADFNEDGALDLAAATDAGFLILLNDGKGTFKPVTSQPFSGGFITHFAIGDINRDGHLDLVGILGSGAIQETLGNGDGTFQAPITLPFPVTSTIAALGSIALGDFNRDGRLDIIYTEFGNLSSGAPPAIHVNLQRVDGTFNGAQVTLTPTFHPTGLLIGDFNGDGSPDIATLSGTVPGEPNSVVVYLGQGILQFSSPTGFGVSAGPSDFLAASLTNTPALDLITTATNANAISVLTNRGANSLTLVSSLNPSGLSQPVTLTATVHPTFPASGSLSGSVMFTDGNSILGTTSVNSSGTGAVTTSFVNAGRHPILAMFGGNSNFVGGSSATLTQVVNKASPSVTLGASNNPSLFGQPVTFSVSVSSSPGAPAPTGTVNLLDGNSIILTGPLDSAGKTSLSTASLAIGSHTLTAQYPGDANDTSASSPLLTQTINKNSSTTTLSVTPTPSALGQQVTLTATVSAAGGGSGTPTGTVNFSDGNTAIGSATLDSNGKGAVTVSTLIVGTHSISVTYAGDSNFSGSTSSNVSQLVNKGSTTTSLTSSPNPAVFGQSLNLSAIVSAAGSSSVIPTGTVTFADGPITIGTATVDNTGKATFSTTSLSAGTHSITATYSGDDNFTGSASTPVSETISKSPSSTALASTPNPSTFGQTVTLRATVTVPGVGIPSGSVNFVDGATTVGSATLDNTGKATISISSFSAGSHVITANYTGDGNFSPSSASGAAGVSQVVSQSNTATALSTLQNPSVFGQPVIFTAVVTASGSGGVPSGTVTFLEGSSALGTTPLDANGSASLTVSSLAVGTHSVTASYSGNASYLSSLSGTVSQTVNKNSVSLTLTSATNPSTFGQAVTFTVAATPGPSGGTPGTARPGGTITFTDGTSVLGNATLDTSGMATFTTNALTAGSHTITATYGGDANFSEGSSSQMQAVRKIPTEISLTSSMNPASPTSRLSLKATLVTGTVQAASGVTPTGTISFSDGTQQLGTSRIDATGQANLPVANLTTGNHTLLASYSGDINFEHSLSPPLLEIIDPSDFTLSVNPNSVQVPAGGSVEAQLVLTPVNGLTGPVNLSCTGVPQGSTCSIKPNMTSLDGKNPITAAILISTTGPGPTAGQSHSPESGKMELALSLLPIAFGCVLIPRCQKKRIGVSTIVILVTLLVGCGGTSFSNKPPVSSTPAGHYALTIRAISGSLVHSSQLSLTVR